MNKLIIITCYLSILISTYLDVSTSFQLNNKTSISFKTNQDDSSTIRKERFIREEDNSKVAVTLTTEDSHSIDELLPKEGSLFNKETIDVEQFDQINCHLRNIDFCYAGLLGGMQNVLPENDNELEIRCDEFQAAASCFSIFNKRCQTFKVFAALSPFSNFDELLKSNNNNNNNNQSIDFNSIEIPESAKEILLNINSDDIDDKTKSLINNLKAVDIFQLCSPQFKKSKLNRLLRDRLFEIGKCANKRINLLKPCIDDLKTALQLFYEPSKVLPLKPSCCALSRFRECSKKVFNNICGLSSFEQLEKTFSGGSFGSQGLKSVNRICREDSIKHNSNYCLEVLPPEGMKTPQRRGSKASKLAKALDLITLSQPASLPTTL